MGRPGTVKALNDLAGRDPDYVTTAAGAISGGVPGASFVPEGMLLRSGAVRAPSRTLQLTRPLGDLNAGLTS